MKNYMLLSTFSLPFETNEAEHGIYEIDVQQNNEKLLVKDALQMNVKGDTFYYLKKGWSI